MIGSNEDDGLILTTPLQTDSYLYILYSTLWSVIAPGILFHIPVEDSSFEASRKASELADFYLGGASNIKPENFDNITDMFIISKLLPYYDSVFFFHDSDYRI